ncbi:MAG: hypothetical protein ACYSUI_20230, partial [Planctomycetota bacterium]
AYAENATLTSSGDIEIIAIADNAASTYASGGAFGAIAAGAMIADVELGRGHGVNEVEAALGDNTTVTAKALRVHATGMDTLRSSTVAASGGLVAVAGADSNITSDNASLVQIGENVDVAVGTLSIRSIHSQNFDSKADSVAFGLGAGTGAAARNDMTTGANVAIGTGTGAATTNITADAILIKAANQFSKDRYANENNLNSGSAGGGTVSVLESGTDIVSEAVVDIGPNTALTVEGSPQIEGVFEIEAFNSGTAVDSVRVESVSGFGVGVGLSRIETETLSGINVKGAALENKTGDIYLATKTDAELRPSANLLVASALTGSAAADVTATNHADNMVHITDSTIKGNDIYVYTGRNINGETNRLEASANAEVTAMSLFPNLAIPIVTADVNETNVVDIQGQTTIRSFEDVNLVANEGIGGNDRARTDGLVLSLSLIPYGISVPDGSAVTSSNQVLIGNDVIIEAGLNNKTLAHLLPLTTKDNGPQKDLYGVEIADRLASTSEVPGIGPRLSDDELSALNLTPGLKYEYSDFDLAQIAFNISQGTIIQVAEDGQGGIVGRSGVAGNYYKYLPRTDEAHAIILEDEDFSDDTRWESLGDTLPEAESQNVVYQSDVTVQLGHDLEDKFYVIKPVEMAVPTLFYVNVGNLLLDQREQVVEWMVSHAGDPDAIARYQVQLDELDDTLEEMGLTQYVVEVEPNAIVSHDGHRYQYIGAADSDGDGSPDADGLVLAEEDYSDTARWADIGGNADPGDIPSDTTDGELLVKKELDSLFLNLPSTYAAPGSIFIEADRIAPQDAQALYQPMVNSDRLIARAGSKIDVFNQTPFTLTVNDAIIRDNKRVEIIDGVYTVFEPGNVYVNNVKLTDAGDEAPPEIVILQDALPLEQYDRGDLTFPKIDQDLYLLGSVINENGGLTVENLEGSIVVSGTIRAETV